MELGTKFSIRKLFFFYMGCVYIDTCLTILRKLNTNLNEYIQGGYATKSRYIVQLLFTTFLRGYFDPHVLRPIDGNKRRLPRQLASEPDF